MDLAEGAPPPRAEPASAEDALDMRDWDRAQVEAWLARAGFGRHVETFAAVGVEGAMLAGIQAHDLAAEELDICEADAAAIIAARDALLELPKAVALAVPAAVAGHAVELPPEMMALALQLADAAAEAIRPYFRKALRVVDKSEAGGAAAAADKGANADKEDPVTIADRSAESAMRTLIRAAFPAHGILGEEHGALQLDAEWVWVLDPIDGTKSFITGTYGWGVLIALAHRGVPVLGIIDQPVLGERWLGVTGQPTTLNGAVVSTRGCATLSTAALFTHDPFAAALTAEDGTLAAYRKLSSACKLRRYSQDCYAYAMLATGCCDVVTEAKQAPWDYMAIVPVVLGAGGVACAWDGSALRLDTAADGSVVSMDVLATGDARLLPEAMAALAR